ncbi:dihydrodipicolinate synthase family protein [Salinarchaeum sp. IM2453]|uniref:dihydrodipicolinate synthase family protein n=1 Tax=Salinarchaeum sp. IM2453 TaxID=2862870 RepID=UPI001C83A4B5|nr:dihydrodipicolinate synthase family protein [Salinarchaeum sp. IM2453]QZA88068.1 dihydrodipicolinate synthase family protein [Salinarchaeum sp. IM2453]
MRGTGVPITTPFDSSGDIHETKLVDVADWLMESGVDFLVPTGSTSEAELLTAEERHQVTKIVAETSSVPVLAGAGHPGRKETLQQISKAVSAGADAVLIVTPFYYEHSQSDLITYYRSIADASSLPVYLYNVPVYTDTSLTPSTVQTLSNHRNIHGIKDSSGDLQQLKRIITLTNDSFDVLVGSGGIYADALLNGADGGILALANIAPELTTAIYTAVSNDNVQKAIGLNRQAAALNHAITRQHGVAGLKHAMQYRGIDAGGIRSPHTSVTERDGKEIQDILDQTPMIK